MKMKFNLFYKTSSFVALTFLLILGGGTTAFAKCSESKIFEAQTLTPYEKKSAFNKSPKDGELERARRDAIIAAFERFPDRCLSDAQLISFNNQKSSIIAEIENYIDIEELVQGHDKKSLKITTSVALRVKSRSIIANLGSGSGNSGGGRNEFIVWIFAAKMAVETTGGSSGGGSTQVFKNREESVVNTQSASTAMEQSASQGNTMATASQSESMSRTTTGGSILKKDDIRVGNTVTAGSRTWQMISTKDLDGAFGQEMVNSGFRAVDYVNAANKCGGEDPSIVKEELALNDDMSQDSWNIVTSALQKCNVAFLAIATLDVNTPEQSMTARGEYDAYVKVNAKVLDLRDFFPVQVGNIMPFDVRAAGLADNAAVVNALQIAGKQAAQEIVAQLSNSGN